MSRRQRKRHRDLRHCLVELDAGKDRKSDEVALCSSDDSFPEPGKGQCLAVFMIIFMGHDKSYKQEV